MRLAGAGRDPVSGGSSDDWLVRARHEEHVRCDATRAKKASDVLRHVGRSSVLGSTEQ